MSRIVVEVARALRPELWTSFGDEVWRIRTKEARSQVIEDTHEFLWRVEQLLREHKISLSRLADMMTAGVALDQLRNHQEGMSVTFVNDNPDFGGPNCLICVGEDFGNPDKQRSYSGETMVECLKAALEDFPAVNA